MGQRRSHIQSLKRMTAALLCLTGLTWLSSSSAVAQTPTGVTYQDDKLVIDVQSITLFELLNKVASATGIRIDLPPETNAEKISRIKLGPGPAREVLAALLRDTHFNFLIAAADGSPEKLSSVLIMPAESKESTQGRDTEPPPRPVRGVPANTESVATRRMSNEDPNESAAAALSSNGSDAGSPDSSGPAQIPAASTAVANAERGPALSPPAVLNQQSISTQLQQMYQQRAQMMQQTRHPGGSGN